MAMSFSRAGVFKFVKFLSLLDRGVFFRVRYYDRFVELSRGIQTRERWLLVYVNPLYLQVNIDVFHNTGVFCRRLDIMTIIPVDEKKRHEFMRQFSRFFT